MFNSQWIPLFVYFFTTAPSLEFLWAFEAIGLSCFISGLTLIFIIFTHCKKGSAYWVKIAPKIMAVMYITDYILIPLSNIGISSYLFIEVMGTGDSYLLVYVLYFIITYITRFLEYFYIVIPILKDGRKFLQVKDKYQFLSKEELRIKLLEIQDEETEEAKLDSDVIRDLLGEKLPYQ